MEEHDEYDYGNDGPTAQGAFLYCFIPTLCMMFDASFIIVGMICLVGADGDFDKCSGDRAFAFAPVPLAAAPIIFRCMLLCLVTGVSSETWSDNELTENEIAGKVAGPPCMCQKAPLSASAMLLIGLVMLVITRIPPYLNRDKHMLKLTENGRKWPCWCVTCRWMREYDEYEEEETHTLCCVSAESTATGSPTPAHQV